MRTWLCTNCKRSVHADRRPAADYGCDAAYPDWQPHRWRRYWHYGVFFSDVAMQRGLSLRFGQYGCNIERANDAYGDGWKIVTHRPHPETGDAGWLKYGHHFIGRSRKGRYYR
jgi:hypothetical protein